MLTEKELEAAIKQITNRLDDVNVLYIKKIAQQIQKIGELNATSIHRLLTMTDMGADVREITTRLATATSLNVQDIYTIYQRALTAVYTDPRFKTALKRQPLTAAQNARITQLAQNVSVQTAQNMYNLSNTTSIMPGYKDAVDRAIMAVSAGGISYTEATRDIIRDVGYAGLQVQYESGYHRRLDTAVRQNIIDGVNQINQHASLAMGEMLGFDAVELSAHLNSAPDHEPVQGRVFLLGEFEKMQNGESFRDVDGRQYRSFRRPIGEWNCMHIAMSFSTQHSVRRYTDEQLEQWRKDNARGCMIDGKHYTNYQARQLMRQIETKIRHEKDAAIAAQLNGNDMEARRAHQTSIDALSKRYYEVAQASGLSPRPIRMSVQGFQAVKTGANQSTKSVKNLAFGEKSGKIKKESLSIYHNSSEKVFKYAKKVIPEKDFEDIFIHGDETGFCILDSDGKECDRYNPIQFAEILKMDPNYHGGNIRLFSCSTGAKGSIAAQALADTLGVTVKAPNDLLWIGFDGDYHIGPDEYTKTGKWEFFTPNQKR